MQRSKSLEQIKLCNAMNHMKESSVLKRYLSYIQQTRSCR